MDRDHRRVSRGPKPLDASAESVRHPGIPTGCNVCMGSALREPGVSWFCLFIVIQFCRILTFVSDVIRGRTRIKCVTINVECRNCGARNRFPDAKAGKTSRCKACGESISVRASRVSRKRKSSSGNGLIIGIAAGAVAIVIVGCAILFMTNRGVDQAGIDQQEVAQQSDADEGGAGTANTQQTNVAGSSVNPERSRTAANTPQNQSTSSPRKGGFDPPSGTAENSSLKGTGLVFSKSADWRVEVDPPAGDAAFEQSKSRPVKLAKDGIRGSGLVFPVSPSPLVAVRTGSGTKYEFAIHDISSGREDASCPCPGLSAEAALAGDGSYLAATLAGNQKIVVHDLTENKTLGTLTTSASNSFQVSQLAIWKNRLVALSTVHKGIMVWELPSGEIKHEIKGGDKLSPDAGFAFSPGGRYVSVIGDYLEKRLEIYDLESGKLVGTITPQGDVKVSELEAVGFSRDGKQLAAVYGIDAYGAGARKFSRMIVWDLPDGQPSRDFELDLRLKDELSPVYKAHTLESLPGAERWLVNSLGIIDAMAGHLIYAFPKQEGVDLITSRKVMGANWLVGAITEKGDPRVEAMEFSEEQLQAGIASASAGGLASDANMPPLTPTDFQNANDAIVETQWSATPDPFASSLPDQTIRLTTSGTVRNVAVSRSAEPVIAVRAGIREDMTDPSIVNYERNRQIYAKNGLELERPQPIAEETQVLVYAGDGSSLADFRVPFSGTLHGISPDGKLALLEQHRTNGRLDLYSLESGEHRAGWRPYRPETDEKNREIKSAQFIDDEHVVALSKNLKLVVWKLPALRPVWKLDDVQEVALSPAGRTLAVVQGNTLGAKNLALLNSQSGAGLGSIDLDGTVKALAFHPAGEFLAMSIDASANKLMRIVDITAGHVTEEFPVPDAANSLCWTGRDYLLLGGTQLISRSLQSVVWSYDSEDVLLPGFQTSEKISLVTVKGKPVFHSVTLPQMQVATRLDPQRLADQAILGPGEAVKLDVQISSDPILSPLKTAPELIQKQLEAAKSKVAEQADITLLVKISSSAEGSTNLSKIGDRSVSIPVTRKAITIDFVYQQGGRELWKSTRKLTNLDRFIVRLEQGQSAQDGIDEQMLKSAESILASVKLPSYIFKEGAGKGLGTSSILE